MEIIPGTGVWDSLLNVERCRGTSKRLRTPDSCSRITLILDLRVLSWFCSQKVVYGSIFPPTTTMFSVNLMSVR